jgi:hypothetical protein
MKKLIAVGVAGGILGFFGGRVSAPNANTQETPAEDQGGEPVRNECERYQTMYDRLREDYIRLQKEQPPTAATGVCSPARVDAREEPSQPKTQPGPAEVTTEADEDTPSEGSAAPNPTGTPKPVPAEDSTPPDKLAVVSVSDAELKKADSGSKRRKLLDRVHLVNPMLAIDSMPFMTAKDRFFDNLHGTFKGNIKFFAKDRKNGRIAVVVRRPEEADPPHAKAWLVRIDVDNGRGKVTRQTGGLDVLRTEGDRSAAFSARSSETSFLQMFYQTASDELIGNYYEKNAAGQYTRQGHFTLKREPY